MASSEAHDQFGAALGALMAVFRSDATKDGPLDVALRVAGAYWGGKLGAKMPRLARTRCQLVAPEDRAFARRRDDGFRNHKTGDRCLGRPLPREATGSPQRR
jgi:hypothetical protein